VVYPSVGEASGSAPPPSASALAAAQRALVSSIVPELGQLRLFVVLNYTAVVKAVKKWNKHAWPVARHGEAGRLDAVSTLLSTPFFGASSLAKTVTRAELLAVSLAPQEKRFWEDFACPICLEVLRNPVLLSCAHRFCFSCLATAALYAVDKPAVAQGGSGLATSSRGLRCDCPVCRKPQVLDEGALRVDPALDDFVRAHFGADRAPAGPENGQQEASCAAAAEEHAQGAMRAMRPATPPVGLLRRSLASTVALRAACRLPKLLLVGIDGCRPDALLLSDAPHARSIVTGGGAFSVVGAPDAHAQGTGAPVPLSGWETLLTGRNDPERAGAHTLFSLLFSVRPWVKGSLVTSLPQLAARCAGAGCLPEPASEDSRAAAAACALLCAAAAPDVVAVQLGEVQLAGVHHGFGPHVALYREAIAQADRRLGALLDAVQRRMRAAPSEDWLVLVTTSGGGTSRTDMPPRLELAQSMAEYRRRGAGAGPSSQAAKPGAAPSAAPQPMRGVYGTLGMPQHEDAFVLLWGPSVRVGEILPCPRPVDVLPAALAHFGVIPRTEWALPGRPYDAVAGAAGWARAAVNLPPAEEAACPDLAEPVDIDEEERAELLARAPGALTCDDVAAAAAAVASCGGLPLAFFASVPGILDPQPVAVMGHRGAGLNSGPRDGASIRENTVESFTAAHAQGATWVEMDVQVTSDGVPVIWHDDDLLSQHESGVGHESVTISEITAAQFCAYGPSSAYGPAGTWAAAGKRATRLLRRYKGAPMGGESAWDCPTEGALPTLENALLSAPPVLGFNLELKFIESQPLTPLQLDAFLRATLRVCEAHARSRRICFSSFDPDAACAMRRLTARWPVLLLTDAAGDAGSPWPRHADARRNGVRSALQVAVAGGLAGVVPEAAALLASPHLVAEIRATGLLCVTWGAANSRPEAVRAQAAWGVCGMITDTVAVAFAALRAGEHDGTSFKAAHKGAAPAEVRAAVASLPPFLGGQGEVPEALLRAHPLADLRYSGHEGAVSVQWDCDGTVAVRQQPLHEDRAAGQRVLAAALATPQGSCSCRPGLVCHHCAFAGGRAAASRMGKGPLVPASPEAPSAAAQPRLPSPGPRLGLAQLLLPSPRLWRSGPGS